MTAARGQPRAVLATSELKTARQTFAQRGDAKDDWQENRTGRCVALATLAVLAIGLFLRPEARAQDTPAPPAAATPAPAAAGEVPATDAEEPSTPAEGALSPEELQALVAPIALYPDLVLVLTLQASLAPLDIVQADRFLARYADDPTLTPDPDWDQSVVGLLNYPSVIHAMNADLDWTQTLGQAVLEQLEGVQDAVQDVRSFMRAVGGLESNDKMTVVVVDDKISIRPTDPDAVFIPHCDPEALLTALYGSGGATEPGAEASPEPEAAAAPGTEAAAPEAAAEPAPAPAEAQAPAEAGAPAPEAVVPAVAPAYPASGYPPRDTTRHHPWPTRTRRRPGSAPLPPSPAAPSSAASRVGRSPTTMTTTMAIATATTTVAATSISKIRPSPSAVAPARAAMPTI